jgi:hypothetical protein
MAQPEPLKLGQNYPNPFNASTSISFDISQAGQVRLDIFNILGEKVVTLVNGPLEAGAHRVTWNTGDLAGGTYFAKLAGDSGVQTRRMTLLK